MKMYILVRDSVPYGYAINAVAHASLACFLKYASHRDMQRWLADSFKKVTCKVTDEELAEAMREADNHVVITESTIGHETIAVAFCPRKEWPELFSEFKLYR
jgi:peptidyl-tRNA hydrolase